MKKEYTTARLFKNRSTTNYLITEEELHDDWDQQQSETQYNSLENNQTVESDANSNKSSLPQRILSVIQRALELLGLDRKR